MVRHLRQPRRARAGQPAAQLRVRGARRRLQQAHDAVTRRRERARAAGAGRRDRGRPPARERDPVLRDRAAAWRATRRASAGRSRACHRTRPASAREERLHPRAPRHHGRAPRARLHAGERAERTGQLHDPAAPRPALHRARLDQRARRRRRQHRRPAVPLAPPPAARRRRAARDRDGVRAPLAPDDGAGRHEPVPVLRGRQRGRRDDDRRAPGRRRARPRARPPAGTRTPPRTRRCGASSSATRAWSPS